MKTNIKLLVLLPFLLVTGCASFQKQDTGTLAVQSLTSMQEVTVGIAKAGDELCKQGTLKQKQCDNLKNYYKKSKVSYDVTADLLKVALKSKDQKNVWDAYKASYGQFDVLFRDLVNLGIEYKLMGGAK